MAGSLEEGSGGQYKEGYYGTFQGQPNMAQPVPPGQGGYYPGQGYPSVAGYPRVAEGTPMRGIYHSQEPLPFCGLGFGWFLFILGFFCVSIPWYVGTFIFFCLTHDYRERAGLAACAIAALVFLLLGGSKAGDMW